MTLIRCQESFLDFEFSGGVLSLEIPVFLFFRQKEGAERSDFKLKKLFNVVYDVECSLTLNSREGYSRCE
jgi:hypothetical protein